MRSTKEIARQLRECHIGKSWTGVCFKELLDDVDWKQATTRIHGFHSIATLVFHINYYIDATIKFLESGELNAEDRFSFDAPEIDGATSWEQRVAKMFSDAESLASIIEELPNSKLWETFAEAHYGNHYRCFQGPIEHCYYHMGQIAILKSMIRKGESTKV
ncbi:MAG: DUF1572 domain-containing protein [Planctomycetota bacterium]